MKTKSFIWAFVMLLFVSLTTAGSPGILSIESYHSIDTTPSHVDATTESNGQDHETFSEDSLKLLEADLDTFVAKLQEIENSPTTEQLQEIQLSAKKLLNRISGLTKNGAENNDTISVKKELEELDKKLQSQKSIAYLLIIGFVLLAIIEGAAIMYFRAKWKKASQSHDDIGGAGKTQANDTEKIKEMDDLCRRQSDVENQMKSVRESIDHIGRRLNQMVQQPNDSSRGPQPPSLPTNSSYTQNGGTNVPHSNGGNSVQPSPQLPTNNHDYRLYAELDASSNGGLLYKAQPTRTANSLYEITPTQPGASEGTFRVLEDIPTIQNVLNNRNSYLAACDFNGNDNATKIVNEAPGNVCKQPNGAWLVTRKAKIRLH